ncbi:hypothetical protein OROGR_025761 [Orobanche gracilis]
MEVFVKSPPSSTVHFPTTLTFFILIISQTHRTTATSFILQSCNTTLYPSLCAKTLTPYASAVKTNPLKLCSVALAVAIHAPENCTASVTKLKKQKGVGGGPEAGAIKDCIGVMKDAVSELNQTVNAMGHLGDADREFQLSNAKTYASAAITDMETCVDGFRDEKVNQVVTKEIRSCISDVEQLISIALSLINQLKY